jgi:hypothetical protein
MKDKQDNHEFDFGGHVKHIEDAQSVESPVEGEATYTDSELEAAGLIKTSAFVRTKRSKNALRVEKNREKKAQSGVKQLNVEVPEPHRETLKAIAKGLSQGLSIDDAYAQATSNKKERAETQESEPQKEPESTQEPFNKTDEEFVSYGKKVAEIKEQGGFRALLINLAGV